MALGLVSDRYRQTSFPLTRTPDKDLFLSRHSVLVGCTRCRTPYLLNQDFSLDPPCRVPDDTVRTQLLYLRTCPRPSLPSRQTSLGGRDVTTTRPPSTGTPHSSPVSMAQKLRSVSRTGRRSPLGTSPKPSLRLQLNGTSSTTNAKPQGTSVLGEGSGTLSGSVHKCTSVKTFKTFLFYKIGMN